jgi:hypothetical protein
MLQDRHVQQNQALVRVLQRRTTELRRHLAFRRLQRALQSREWRTVHRFINRDALIFIVQRLADRLRGRLYLLRRRLASSSCISSFLVPGLVMMTSAF